MLGDIFGEVIDIAGRAIGEVVGGGAKIAAPLVGVVSERAGELADAVGNSGLAVMRDGPAKAISDEFENMVK